MAYVFEKTVFVGVSQRTGNEYLYIKDKNNKMIMINLIKDNKKFAPVLKGVSQINVKYSSYRSDFEKNTLTLFNVSDVAFYKAK